MERRKYPSLDQVESASRFQVCAWYRFLPNPTSKEQIEILDRIIVRFQKLGGFTPEISKALGHGGGSQESSS